MDVQFQSFEPSTLTAPFNLTHRSQQRRAIWKCIDSTFTHSRDKINHYVFPDRQPLY